MSRKPYQILMDPRAHAQLKKRANQLGVTIGEMIENLLASAELRISRLVDIHVKKPIVPTNTNLMKLLLLHDAGELSMDALITSIKAEVEVKEDDQYKPVFNKMKGGK